MTSKHSSKRSVDPLNDIAELPVDIRKASEKLAGRYEMRLVPDDAGVCAKVAEFPGIVVRGRSANECIKFAIEAITLAVAATLSAGGTPPTPIAERRIQFNVRLSAGEKETLERASRSKGFRGLADYARAVLLADAGALR